MLRAVRSGSRLRSIAAVALGFAVVVPALGGCSKKSDKTTIEAEKRDLPPLSFDPQTPNLMLTWIDGRGATHVEQKPDFVPKEQKKLVRVLIQGDDAGTSDPIYVADLSSPNADGKFFAHSLPRSEWDDEIQRRREARVASLPDGVNDDYGDGPPRLPGGGVRTPRHPGGDPGNGDPGHGDPGHGDPGHGHGTPGNNGGPGPGEDPNGDDPPRHFNVNVPVVVYGASWCGPCHMAMRHFDAVGVKYTFKDIDKDSAADSEMNAKLAKAHLRGGSIPVIDIGGHLTVGYNEEEIDQLLQASSGGTAL